LSEKWIPEGFYSVTEAANRLGVSTKTIYRRIKKGSLSAQKKDSPQGVKVWIIPECEITAGKEAIEVITIVKDKKNTIYITGFANTSKNDPINILYRYFFVGLVIERNTSTIIDATCNTVSSTTSNFIKSILVGYSLIKDIDKMEEEINERFLGLAQKALIVALKDARNKYLLAGND